MLEIVGRCLNYNGGLEPFCLHAMDHFDVKIVDEAQAVRASGTNIDVSSPRVLVAQPFDHLLDIDGSLPFPKDHVAGVGQDPEIETVAAHRPELAPYHPLHDFGRFPASLFVLGFRHRQAVF
jgi:hypothetical protein